MIRLLACISLLALSAVAVDQHAVMVWDQSNQETCPLEITVLPTVRLEIPLDEQGQPVKSQARIIGIKANYNPGCGRIEVKR